MPRSARRSVWISLGFTADRPADDGQGSFETLRAVRAAVACEVAVAGGIHSGTAAKAAEAGADIVVIGGAITKAENATQATKDILGAPAPGARSKANYSGGSPRSGSRKCWVLVSTPNLSDAMHRSGEMLGLEPLQIGVKVFGRAVTVRTYPGIGRSRSRRSTRRSRGDHRHRRGGAARRCGASSRARARRFAASAPS